MELQITVKATRMKPAVYLSDISSLVQQFFNELCNHFDTVELSMHDDADHSALQLTKDQV